MQIAYAGPFSFPSSNANSLRVKGIAGALAMSGHDVQIYPGIKEVNGCSDIAMTGKIRLHSLDEYERGLFSGFNRGLRGLFMGDVTARWLESLQKKPDVLIVYGTHLGYLLRMLPFCARYKIPLVLDIVEWYDPAHLPGGMLGPFAIANELSMRFVAKRAAGMFTVSRYLDAYFREHGCRTLRVPPLFSLPQVRPQQFRASNQKLNLCYAGSPGKKEDMASLFAGLQMASSAGIKVMLHIVGITANEFARNFGIQSLPILGMDGIVKFYGRLANADARQIIASCDLMVLLRKDIRATKAGFPSKVAESLCLGTPVIANLTSNLDEYLVDDFNSIIVENPNAGGFYDALKRASQLNEHKISSMHLHSFECASRNFVAEHFAASIDAFLLSVR